MHIRYEQQRRDVADAVRLLSGRKLMYFFGAIWLILLLLNLPRFAFSMSSGRGFIEALGDNGTAVLLLALLALFLSGLVWLQPKLAARKAILRPLEWHLSADGVRIQSDVASSEIRWPAFLKYREGRQVFLLYVQKNQAQFIPKRVLAEEQQEELRRLLSGHVKLN